MSGVGRLARTLNEHRHRIRFRWWVLRSRALLRYHGIEFVVDAPHGCRFAAAPVWRVTRDHDPVPGPARFELSIGRNVDLGRRLELEVRRNGASRLELRDEVYFLTDVRVVLSNGTIGLGPICRVRDNAMIKAFRGRLEVGARTSIGFNSMIHCDAEVVLEDMVGLSERVTIVDSDHTMDGSDVYNQATPILRDPIRIGSNCLVAANSVVLRGARIGRNSVVAAGAVVRGGEYPSGWVIGGVPARPLKALPAAADSAQAEPAG